MRKEFIKVAILIFVFFTFYFFLGFANYGFFGATNSSQDFEFHFSTAKNFSMLSFFNFEYPPFYHMLASYFTENPFVFYVANLILIIVLIPVFVFIVSGKKAFAVLLYFCGTSLMHSLVFGSTFPEALVLLFVLIYFSERRNLHLWIVLTVLAFLTHKSGGYLFLLIGIAEVISIFAQYLREDYKQKAEAFLPAGYLIGTRLNSFESFFHVLIGMLPIPILYFGIKRVFSSVFYAIIFLGGLAAAIHFDIRALSVVQLIFCFVVAEEIETKNYKLKLGLMFLLAAQTIYYLVDFGFTTWKLILF